jgi:hypothetical protein
MDTGRPVQPRASLRVHTGGQSAAQHTHRSSAEESEGQGARTASRRECRDRDAQKDDSASSASFSAAGRSSPRENLLECCAATG